MARQREFSPSYDRVWRTYNDAHTQHKNNTPLDEQSKDALSDTYCNGFTGYDALISCAIDDLQWIASAPEGEQRRFRWADNEAGNQTKALSLVSSMMQSYTFTTNKGKSNESKQEIAKVTFGNNPGQWPWPIASQQSALYKLSRVASENDGLLNKPAGEQKNIAADAIQELAEYLHNEPEEKKAYREVCDKFATVVQDVENGAIAASIPAEDEDASNAAKAAQAGFTQINADDVKALSKAAIEDLRWLATNPVNKPEDSITRAGNTRALVLLKNLMIDTMQENNGHPIIDVTSGGPVTPAYLDLADARNVFGNAGVGKDCLRMATAMSAILDNPGKSQELAQNALREIFPHSSKVEKQSQQSGLPVTTFLRKMRAGADGPAKAEAAARRQPQNFGTEGDDDDPIRTIPGIPDDQLALSGYDIMQHNIEAAAKLSATQVHAALVASGATNIPDVGALTLKLTEGIQQEVDKSPQDIKESYGLTVVLLTGNNANAIPAELRTKLTAIIGDDANQELFANGIKFDNINNVKECLQKDLEAARAGRPTNNTFNEKAFDSTQLVAALQVVFEMEIAHRKAQLQRDKTRFNDLPTGTDPMVIANWKKAIAEQEAVIAARECYSKEGDHGLLIAGKVAISMLGGFAGLAVGTGVGAGIGAGAAAAAAAGVGAKATDAAMEAISELLKGQATKFADGLAAGNPILVIAVIGAGLGLAGFIAGIALAAEASGRVAGGKEVVDANNKAVTKLVIDEVCKPAARVANPDTAELA